MLVASPQALYGRVSSTEVSIRQVRRATAKQRKKSPLWQHQKRGKNVNSYGTTVEVNITTPHDAPIPRKTKGKTQENKHKRDKDTAVPKEKEGTYGIDHQNIGDPAFELENDSK